MRNSFHTIAKNLKQSEEVKSLPTARHTRCQKYKTSLISTTSMNKKAVFRESCISLFNKQKLEKKRKSAESICLKKVESRRIDDIDQDTV